MIRLGLTTEPRWFDLGFGVRVKCRPLTTRLLMAANLKAQEADGGDPAGDLMASTLRVAALSIVDWEGVDTADGATPAPVTEANVRELMEIPPMFTAFQEQVMRPWEAFREEKKD